MLLIKFDYLLIGRREAVQKTKEPIKNNAQKSTYCNTIKWSLSAQQKDAKQQNECYILHTSFKAVNRYKYIQM